MQPIGQIRHDRNRQVLDRAGTGFGDSGGNRRAAMPRHDEAIGPSTLGAAHDRSQVTRVADTIERNDQRAFDGEQLVAIDVRKRIDMGGNALVIGVAD